MIHPIVRYPAGVLTGVAEPVTEFGPALEDLEQDLIETCREYKGEGLAAPQIGVGQRVVVVLQIGRNATVLVNPSWTPVDGDLPQVTEEGCLSLPDVHLQVERAFRITVQALSVNREPLQFVAEGLFAQAIQHECEHLDGILIVDHLSPTQRSLTLAVYRKHVKKMVRRVHAVLRGRRVA